MKARVAFVIPRYFPIFGGAENQCRALLRQLKSRDGAEVPFLLTGRWSTHVSEKETIDGIEVFRLGRPGMNRWNYYFFYLKTIQFLLLHRGRWDLIHCHATSLVGLVCVLVGILLRKKVILKLSTNGELLQGEWAPSSTGGIVERLKAIIRHKTARVMAQHGLIVALNPEGAEEARIAGSKYVQIVPNGIDTGVFQPLREELRLNLRKKMGIAPNSLAILYVGRFVKRKGLELLVDAFEGAIKKCDTARASLFLAGSGELQANSSYDSLFKRSENLKGKLVILPPAIPPVEYYQMADIFVSPAFAEGMPNTVLEALAIGLPCILSDIRPHMDLVLKNSNARIRLFKTGSLSELTELLSESIHNASQLIAQPNKAGSLEEQFHIDNVALRYEAIYHQLATAGRKGSPRSA